MTWRDLFDRAPDGVTVDDVRAASRADRDGADDDGNGAGDEGGRASADAGRRGGGDGTGENDGTGEDDGTGENVGPGESSEADDRPDPTRVVADADVLAADLLVGGEAREALDVVRAHSWVALVASDPLLDDAGAKIATLADADLAADWRDSVEAERVRVEHPAGDHPGLASAYHGNAAHLLSCDETLRSAETGATLQKRMDLSVKPPDGFARLFDPESLHEAVLGGDYPGPDRDPRA